jgi:hypothetical protein
VDDFQLNMADATDRQSAGFQKTDTRERKGYKQFTILKQEGFAILFMDHYYSPTERVIRASIQLVDDVAKRP